jgi:hypothetical protein
MTMTAPFVDTVVYLHQKPIHFSISAKILNKINTQGTKNRGQNQNRNRLNRASQLHVIQDLARLLN